MASSPTNPAPRQHGGASRSSPRRPPLRPDGRRRNAAASRHEVPRTEPPDRTGGRRSGEHRGQHQAGRSRAAENSTGRQRSGHGPGSRAKALGGLGRLSLTSRAFILAAAVVMVFVMITPSLGVYFRQRSELADLNSQQTRTSQQIADLQDELKRWDDPDYVRTQARSQLGWVVPGETGYRVIGKDGKVLGQGNALDMAGDTAPTTQTSPWWQKMVGSVRTADAPARSTGQR